MAEPTARITAGRPSLEPCGMVHVEVLAELHAVLFPEAWDSEAFRTLMAIPGTLGLMARDETAPVGFVLGRIAADECEILTIGVLPAARRHGIAGALLDGLIGAAGRAGARRIFLEVGSTNGAARRLYESRRFREVGRRPGYYRSRSGPVEDALILRLDTDCGTTAGTGTGPASS